MSLHQKTAYILFLSLALVLPLLVGSSFYPREKIYLSSTVNAKGAADVHWLHHLIFEEKGPIDLLIIGASQSWVSLRPQQLEQMLSSADKPFVVRTMSHNWASHDLEWSLLQDLLDHREVRNVLIGSGVFDFIRPYHEGLFEVWPKEFLDQQPARITFFQQYAIRMYEAPRKALELLRSGGGLSNGHAMPGGYLPEGNMRFGNLEVEKHVAGGPFKTMDVRVPENISFEEPVFDREDDDYYLHKIHDLLRSKNINVHWLSIVFAGRDPVIRFSKVAKNWPEEKLFGLDPKTLFSKYTDEEMKYLFYDGVHMNINGARLYTEVVGAQFRDYLEAKNE